VGRAEDVTRFIKRYDPKLYCEKSREGKLCVFRKGQTIESYDVDGTIIDFVRPAPYLVFALTNDWTVNGEPCDRGLDPIYFRLQEIDVWNRDLAKESLQSIVKGKESRARAVENHIESYLLENRREFARLTNDINTSTLDKKMKLTGDN
jgi:hypothetical protein